METRPRSEINFRVLVEHALDVTSVLDVEGRILYASPSFEQAFGYRDVEGMRAFDFVHPDDLAKVQEVFASIVQVPGATASAELRYRHKDGRWLCMESSAKNLLDDPQLGGILVNSRDITQRVEAERELEAMRDHLQERVQARTADFEHANVRLQQEVEERRKAEEIIHEQEEHFRLLFQNNPLPMWVYDLDTLAFLEVNAAAITNYGYTRKEFLHMRITDIRPEEDVPALVKDARGPRPTLQRRGAWRHRLKDGTLIDVEITSHTLLFQGKEAALIVAQDVTEQNQVQGALQESEARYRSVVTNAPVILFALDAEGVFTLSEGQGLARLGLEPGEVVGRSIFDLYAAYPDVLEKVRAGLAGEAVGWTIHIGNARFDAHSAPMYDEHGEVTGLTSVATDVTERHEARQRLEFLYRTMSTLLADALDYRKSLRQLAEAVVPALADWCALHIVGEDGALERLAVVHADPSKAAFVSESQAQTGVELSATVGPGRVLRTGEAEFYPEVPDHLLAELAQDEEHLRQLRGPELTSMLIVPLVARGQTLGVLTLATAESGRRYDSEDLTLAEDLAHRAGLVIDSARLFEATQRANAELEERVHERTAQLEAANQELESFSYSVSHDLRSPLRAIEGFTRILVENHADALDAKAQDYLLRVRRNALRMGTLIDDLLQFSRLGRKELQRQTVRPADLVRQVVEELDPVPEGREVEFDIGDLPACQADPQLLKQVYVNLLGNALKFSQYRDPAVVRVGAERRGGKVVYSVSDNGAGFDMAYADKLFGVFQRLHRAEEYEGTGVGLAIVQRIIHRHGGEVWAESAPGEGATFSFTLPPATPPQTAIP